MIQIKRHQKKEDYSLMRNQLSQEQQLGLFKMVCFFLVIAAIGLIFVTMHMVAQ